MPSPLTGWGCCRPADLKHRGEEQNPRESTRWLRHERARGELGLLTVLGCRSVHLSADTGSRVKMPPSPAFPLPGMEDPPAGGQTNRQAGTPLNTTVPLQTKLLQHPKTLQSLGGCTAQAQPLLSLPPLPAFTSSALLSSKKAGKNTQALLPAELFPSIPTGKSRSKHFTTYFCAGASGEKGTAQQKAQPGQKRLRFGTGRRCPCAGRGDMSQLRRTSVWQDIQQPLCGEERGIAGGHPHSPGLALRGKEGRKIGTGRQGESEGSSRERGPGGRGEGAPPRG